MSTTETVAGAAGEASEKGMPQLNFATWPNQVFWLLVALVIIYIVMTKIAMPRIAAVLAERKGRIGGDLAAAEELKSKAKAAEAAYNLALEQARLEAAKIIAATKARTAPNRRCADGSWLKSASSSQPASSIMSRGPSEVPCGPEATMWSRAARHSADIWVVPQLSTS